MTPLGITLLLLAGVNSCIGNILLKVSRVRAGPNSGTIDLILSPWFIGGLFFYVINVVLFAKALDTAPVSVAYPVLATSGFALLVLASYFVFGERLSAMQGLGLVLAVSGISLLAWGNG